MKAQGRSTKRFVVKRQKNLQKQDKCSSVENCCHFNYRKLMDGFKTMKSDAAPRQAKSHEICVHECEIHLKFRLVEEKCVLFGDREELLEFLIEAFTTGADEYMEPIETQVKVEEVSDLDASVQMRRLLMRLRNSSDLTKSPPSFP